MKREETINQPTIILDKYEDFMEYAADAALVTYKPEYFHSPFLDDEKRLRRVTFHAIGVMRQGIALTFKYTFDYDCIYDPSLGWDDLASKTDKFLTKIIQGLEAAGNLVQGNIGSEKSLGESLASL
jgi:hypothetical protein